MGLSGRQRKELQSALVDAFPTKASLEQMLSFELDKNLEAIAGEGSLEEIVFNIIRKAEAEEWIKELIRAARRTNPGNSKLQAINQSLGSQISSRNKTQKKLLEIVSTEVESRLEQSLHNRIYIIQDIDQNPSQIELPWSSEIKIGSKPKVHLTNTQITTVYDQPDIAGRLLILGQPGAGKTTMLLKLASELIKRAREDPVASIPVLFSLFTWKKDNQSIKDWLVEQLKDKYGVRKDIGKKWVETQEILPLLDGLDELAAERQERCVRKINDFLHPETWSDSLVVCSRTEEYQHYATLLQLNNSLELCPFTQEQVYQYLQNTGNSQLWNSISHDTDLSQLTRIPFLLNIIVLSAQEISVETWQQFKSSEERLFYLFEAYIRRMLKRPYKGKQPNQKSTKWWLAWLAQQLMKENATEFLIEKMQPYWLKSEIQKIVYNLILGGVIAALIHCLSGGLISGLIFVSIWVFGGSKIETVETLYFSLKKFRNVLMGGLIGGLSGGLMGGLIFGLIFGQIENLIFGLVGGLSIGLLGGLVLGLILGINSLEIKNKSFPNQGIRQSVINVIILFLITFPSSTIFLLIILWMRQLDKESDERLISSLAISLILGFFVGIFIGIFKGGIPAIKHFALRVVLWSNGYIPWNYAKFLDYCTNRLFLQRVGGGYRFMHELLRQHFAKSYSQKS